MACFTNVVYVECAALFGFLETVHHFIEHEEADSHKGVVAKLVGHDDIAH